MGVAQRLAPVAASTATQYSSSVPLAFSLEIRVNARSWLTTRVLKPLVRVMFVQTTVGPLDGQLMGSGVIPSWVGPRYWGQSIAAEIRGQVRIEQRTAVMRSAAL